MTHTGYWNVTKWITYLTLWLAHTTHKLPILCVCVWRVWARAYTFRLSQKTFEKWCFIQTIFLLVAFKHFLTYKQFFRRSLCVCIEFIWKTLYIDANSGQRTWHTQPFFSYTTLQNKTYSIFFQFSKKIYVFILFLRKKEYDFSFISKRMLNYRIFFCWTCCFAGRCTRFHSMHFMKPIHFYAISPFSMQIWIEAKPLQV